MPKLRPLRKPEEIAAVPTDRSVAIDLSDEVAVAAETPEPEPKPAETRAPEPEPEPRPEEQDEDESPLKKQLDEIAERERRLADDRVADQARHAAEIARERARADARIEQSDYDTIVIGISSQEAEADRAQSDIEAALASGDIKAQAEANRRQQTALVKIARLEESREAIEARREQEKARPAAPAAPDFEARIASLPEAAKTWLRSRREYIDDPAKYQQVLAADQYVTTIERKPAWTPEYFASLETHLGLRQAPPAAAQTERRSPPVSAPVSRDTPSMSSGRPQRRTVELSPEQREAAKISGVDDLTYAKGVLELERRKRLGMYPDR